MESKKEQALVGLFVLLATGLLLGTIFAISGALGPGGKTYTASFRFAGGLEAGAVVRYAGGPKAGRVERLRIDPQDPSRIEITFSLRGDVPVKTDSRVKISYLGALAENYLEITPGSAGAPPASSGSKLPAEDYVSFADIAVQVNALGPEARKLVEELNVRAADLKDTIARVNDLLNQRNRENISSSLGEVRGMLEENRPRLRSTMGNIEKASGKFTPLLEDFKKAVAEADQAIRHIDELVGETRPDFRETLDELNRTLASASEVVDQMGRLLNANSDNLDEIMENMRLTTQNLKQFTDQIKTRPSALIRSSGPPDRKPGGPAKP